METSHMCSETKETGCNGVDLDLPQAKPPTVTTITSTRLCFHGTNAVIHHVVRAVKAEAACLCTTQKGAKTVKDG